MKIYFQDGKPVYDDTVMLGLTYIDYSTLSESLMKWWRNAFESEYQEAMVKGERKSALVTESNKT